MALQTNTVYCGDCKPILERLPEYSVSLIYADPPFFSNRHYEVIWKDGYKTAFEDRWKGGINNYVAWMKERLRLCHKVLKKTGSMYLHCDWHASHYLKIEMDRIFGEQNFINEIIWKRRTAHSDQKQGSKHFGKIHDTILFYSKSNSHIWNPQYVPYSEDYIEKGFPFREEKTGRYYQLNAITGPGGASKGNPYYEFLGVTRYWRFKKETMERLYKDGRVVQTKPGNVPRQKRYLDEMPGVELQDIWLDIKPVSNSKEDLGYPTQKPEAMLQRIIKTSSNKNDIVLDPFCGCGTAIIVAQKEGRRWIGIDVSPTACKLSLTRVNSLEIRRSS